MWKWINLAILGLVLGLAAFGTKIATDTKRLRGQVEDLRDLKAARTADLRTKQAEAAYLGGPERIAKLAGAHLDLEPVRPDQRKSLKEAVESLPEEARGKPHILAQAPGPEGSVP